jgi:hypothetical protein
MYDLSHLKREKQFHAPRILLLGAEKVGKSSFACQAPDPIVIPMKGEEGVDDLINADVHATDTCESLDNVLGWLYALYTNDTDRKTIILDSASALQPLLWDTTIKRWNSAKEDKQKTAVSIETVGGGYAKGYNEALVEWRLITEALDALRKDKDMMSIIIGHVTVKEESDPIVGVYNAFNFALDRRAASLLYQWADLILFANYKGAVKKEEKGFNAEAKRGIDNAPNQRFLYTQKRLAHPGGCRGIYGQLPYEIPLNWNSFMEAVNNVNN